MGGRLRNLGGRVTSSLTSGNMTVKSFPRFFMIVPSPALPGYYPDPIPPYTPWAPGLRGITGMGPGVGPGRRPENGPGATPGRFQGLETPRAGPQANLPPGRKPGGPIGQFWTYIAATKVSDHPCLPLRPPPRRAPSGAPKRMSAKHNYLFTKFKHFLPYIF